jgi:hypothetical protein
MAVAPKKDAISARPGEQRLGSCAELRHLTLLLLERRAAQLVEHLCERLGHLK